MTYIDCDNEYLKQSVKLGQVPEFLFKYTRLSDIFLTTLCNSELSFSNPMNFNDPFDCQINDQTSWTKELVEEYIETNKRHFNEPALKMFKSIPPHLFNKFYKEAIADSISKIGVTCFSKSPTNLLLWSHYAFSHTGICLKFDVLQDLDFFYWTFPINYSDSYPVYNYGFNKNEFSKTIILAKSNHWSYEEEFRTLKETTQSHKFKKNSLVEVIFGCKTNKDEMESVIQKLNSNGFEHVKFKKVILQKTKFDIEFVNV